MNKFFSIIIALTAFVTLSKAQTVVDIAASNKDFSTLVSAVKAADLVETLSSEGPFTVFAPTNDAFDKIDKSTLNYLLKKENKKELSNILTYHVLSGNFSASDVVGAIKLGGGHVKVKTVNGQYITFYKEYDKVFIKDAKGNHSRIIKTDIDAKNGTVHVLENVILPKPKTFGSHYRSSCN